MVKTIYQIIDPDTGEIVQELKEDFGCRASRAQEPLNEACGGCTRCLLMQAEHSGFKIKTVREDEHSSN